MTDGSRSPFSRSDSALTDWHSGRRAPRFPRASSTISTRTGRRCWITAGCGESKSVFGNIAIALNPDGTGRTHLRNVSCDQDWEGINFKLNGNYTLLGRSHELVAGGITRDSTRYDSSFIRDMSQVGFWRNEGGRYVPEPDWSSYKPALTNQSSGSRGCIWLPASTRSIVCP